MPCPPPPSQAIRVGDSLVAINGVAVAALPRGAASARVRGPPGSRVALHVPRLGAPAPTTVEPPPPPPPSRTDWTRLVPPPVLTGHVSSLSGGAHARGARARGRRCGGRARPQRGAALGGCPPPPYCCPYPCPYCTLTPSLPSRSLGGWGLVWRLRQAAAAERGGGPGGPRGGGGGERWGAAGGRRRLWAGGAGGRGARVRLPSGGAVGRGRAAGPTPPLV
jgi:translation initiation factor IF-2